MTVKGIKENAKTVHVRKMYNAPMTSNVAYTSFFLKYKSRVHFLNNCEGDSNCIIQNVGTPEQYVNTVLNLKTCGSQGEGEIIPCINLLNSEL